MAGLTGLVRSFGETLRGLPRDWRQRRDRWFEDQGMALVTRENLGIPPRLAPFVDGLADIGEGDLRREDAAELPRLYGFDLPVSLDVALAWAETMAFLRPSGRDTWKVNPLLVHVAAYETRAA